jgi:hypothetical protein
MSLSQPTPPNPYTVANAQEELNKQSAQYQAQINDVNQITPYGSLTYAQTGTYADGMPMYTATQSLSAPEQQLFNTTVGTQEALAGDASKLAANLGGSLTNAPNLNNGALTQQDMDWANQYMQPLFNQQQGNLNAQLAAQGITQGSQAYNNAQNLQNRNVNNAYQSFFMQAEPQAYSQALQTYEAPIQTLGTLLGEGQPGTVGGSLTQTPQEQIQPADIESIFEDQYSQQNQIYANTMSGLFGTGSALLGGLARAIPFGSDIRIKENIVQVGRLKNGLPIYQFNYIFDPDGIPRIGLMAQDVEKVHPEAVGEINGIKHVNYALAVKDK